MRITQTLATKAAKLLTTKTAVAIEALSSEVDAMAKDAYMKSLPKGLVAFDKAYPGWVTKVDDLRVKYRSCGKLETYYTNLGVDVPAKDGYAKVSASRVLRAKVVRLVELEEKHRALKKEAYAAVLALGTSKHVLKSFPELAELFGAQQPGEAAPIPTINDLKKKLQKQ